MQFQHFTQTSCLSAFENQAFRISAAWQLCGAVIAQKSSHHAWLRQRHMFSLLSISVNYSRNTLFYKTAKAWKVEWHCPRCKWQNLDQNPQISLIPEDSFQADAGIVPQHLEQGWHLAVKEELQWESSIGFVQNLANVWYDKALVSITTLSHRTL